MGLCIVHGPWLSVVHTILCSAQPVSLCAQSGCWCCVCCEVFSMCVHCVYQFVHRRGCPKGLLQWQQAGTQYRDASTLVCVYMFEPFGQQ